MGNFLETIQKEKQPINNPFLNTSFSKLREYYSSFKSVCDTFSIDTTQYAQIFSSNQNSFRIWDTDQNGMIDAIELFSGLILFSDAKFENKIRFLFDIFDLNEENVLYFDNIEFILISSCNATYKIYGIKEEINDQIIEQFINQFFYLQTAINYNDFLKWCSRVEEIRKFFKIIKKKIPEEVQIVHQVNVSEEMFKEVIKKQKLINYKCVPFKKLPILIKDKKYINLIEWTNKNMKIIQKKIYPKKSKDINIKIKWVYGIRINDIINPIIYIKNQGDKAASQKFLFMQGSIVIIFYPNLNQQRHYTEHYNDVISLASAKQYSLCASGQLADQPAIHIWNNNTLVNLGIIKGIHKKGIKMISFINNDQFIVTVGIGINSAIIIYNVKDLSLVISTFIKSSSLELFPVSHNSSHSIGQISISKYTVYQEQTTCFIIVTQQNISHFRYYKQCFITNQTSIRNYQIRAKIVCATNVPAQDNVVIIVTGHQDGQIIRWQNLVQPTKIFNCPVQINHLFIIQQYICLLIPSKLYLIDSLSLQVQNEVQINIPLVISNNFIYAIVLSNKVLLLSVCGDLIQLYFSGGYKKYEFKKEWQLFKMEDIAAGVAIKNMLYLVNKNGIIWEFDSESKELIHINYVPHKLNSIDGYSTNQVSILALGTQQSIIVKKIYMKQSLNNSDDLFKTISSVSYLKFSYDHLYLIAACQNRQLFIFFSQSESFLKNSIKKIVLDYDPISISFVDDSRAFLITAKDKNIYKMSFSEFKQKNITEQLQNLGINIWQTYYPLNNSNLPVLMSNEIIIAATQNNSLLIWNQVFQNGFSGILLKTQVNQIILQLPSIFTCGKQICIEWNIIPITYEDPVNNVILPQILQSQIQFCDINKTYYQLENAYMQIRSTKNKIINNLIQKFLLPESSKHYQKLVQPWTQNEYLPRRPPPLRIQIDFMFGFDCSTRRNSLFYGHEYSPSVKQIKPPLKMKKEKIMQVNSSFNKEMLLSKQSLLPYDQQHDGCNKYFIYSVGRIAIIYNPNSKKQKFYQGHTFKITCFIIHPLKYLVASSQCYFKPRIHIWNIITCETFKVIQTFHQNGIKLMTFSRDGLFIVSVSADPLNTIEVFNWKSQQIVASRSTSTSPIIDIKFNPYCNYQFATAGNQCVFLWQINCKNLLRKSCIKAQQFQVEKYFITAISYISYSYGDKIESDIVAVTSQGDISLIACEKYILVKKKAHNGFINCLKITQIFHYKIIIITAGEDQKIKLWDTKFTIINQIDLRKNPYFIQVSKSRNLSAQSIDIFHCRTSKLKDQKKDNQKVTANPILLIGTRNGDILEVGLTNEFKGLKVYSSNNENESKQWESSSSSQEQKETPFLNKADQLFSQSQSIRFNYLLHMRNHSCFKKKKIDISIYGNSVSHSIMATVGYDKNIILWNLENNELLNMKELETIPTVCQFHPSGDFLVVGFQNGLVSVFDTKMFNKESSKQIISIPSLELLYSIRDREKKGLNISNIKFSDKGQKMAISYIMNNEVKKQNQEVSTVAIFSVKLDDKKKTNKNLFQKGIFVRICDIRIKDYIDNEKYSQKIIGCYFINFSKSENERFIMLYVQQFENKQRNNKDQNGFYLFWDTQKQEVIKNFQFLKQIEWQSINFANSIIAKKIIYNNILITSKYKEEIEDQFFHNKKSSISAMCQYQNILILGTVNGQLVISKPTLFYCDKENINETYFNKQNMMGLCKIYKGHPCSINHMQIINNFILTCSSEDQGIIKWKLIPEPQNSDMDYTEYDIFNQDPYEEYMSKTKFERVMLHQLPFRQFCYETMQNVSKKQHKCQLELSNIIGRTAYNKRNNLFYDYDQRIVYVSGCNLIITTINEKPNGNVDLTQQFIKIDNSQFTNSTEIGSFTLSQDKKLFAGTTIEQNAKLIIWDISSRICISSMILKNIVTIVNCKFSFDNRNLCCTGLSKQNSLIMFLINVEKEKIQACIYFKYSSTYKIRDIYFLPNSNNKFITCGKQYLALWKTVGGIFQSECFTLQNLHNDPISVDFYTIISVKGCIITAGANGYIYIWDQSKHLKNQQNAHPNAAILSMYSATNSVMFVSGGEDGKVNLWQIGANYIAQKFYQYNLYNQSYNPMQYHVQSVNIGGQYILAGTRSGDVYELARPDLAQMLRKGNKDQRKLRLSCHTHERPKACDFSPCSKKLYTITQKGLLAIFNLKNLVKLNELHLESLSQKVVNMFIGKLSHKIILAFKTQICIYYELENYDIQEVENMEFQSTLADMKISNNQKIVAVLFHPNNKENSKIILYQIKQQSEKLYCKLVQFHTMINLSSSIQFIDFSTDNSFLLILYYDTEQTQTIQLQTLQKNMTFNGAQMLKRQLSFKKTSDKVKGIFTYYREENKVLNIEKIRESYIVVTDMMGTIRMFSYPALPGCQGYYKCYTDHLTQVSLCKLSPNLQNLVTASEIDRSYIIWNIKDNP